MNGTMQRSLQALVLCVVMLAAAACAAALGEGRSAPLSARAANAIPRADPIGGADSPQRPSDKLPATSTPSPRASPTPTPRGGGVDNGWVDLQLTGSDADGIAERANQIYQQRIANGGEVDRNVLLDAYKQLADYRPVGGRWRGIGPAPINGVYMPQGQIPGSGRVNGFAIDPRDTNIVLAAASAGGLWKTTDSGKTWKSLTDKQVPVILGGIVMDPKNPDTMYGLLGEFDGQVAYTVGYLANGIMRSRDGGNTWTLIGADTFKGASVSRLVFAPDGTMYASSGQESVFYAPPDQPDYGIFKSTDGGDHWTRLNSCGKPCVVSNPAIKAKLGGFFDLQRTSDGTLYTSLCYVQCLATKLYRSRDDGQSWQELKFQNVLDDLASANLVSLLYQDSAKTLPSMHGLEIAVSQQDPQKLLVGGGIYFTSSKRKEIPWSFAMRSTDGGDTWEWLADAGDYCSSSASTQQCDYDNIVEIDPTNDSIMYLGGSFTREKGKGVWVAVIRRSEDGGDTWTDLTPNKKGSWMHPDSHGMAFDPKNTDILWVGNDGGIYRTASAKANPPQWVPSSQGMNTLLFIGIGLHPTDPNGVIGGLQDNADALTTDGGKIWLGVSQGDAGDAAYDPFDPTILYSTAPQGSFMRNSNSGKGGWKDWTKAGGDPYTDGFETSDRFLFYAPFIVDPKNEGVLYIGAQRVFKTEDRGDSWNPISKKLVKSSTGGIETLALSFSDPNVLYAGTTDGLIWVTPDGGTTWTNITASSLPPRNIYRIVVDPTDSQTIYVAYGGFNVQTPDKPGHIFRTTNGGKTWEDLSKNLPDSPLHAVVVDVRPKYAGVYVGGSLGVWTLQKGATQWLPYGTGMPFSIVWDLELNPTTGIMAAATYGRSIWEIDMP